MPKADDKPKHADAQPKVAAKDAPKDSSKDASEESGREASRCRRQAAARRRQRALPPPKPPAIPAFEHKSIKIGSLDPATGYFLEAELDSKGASIASLRLNDPRYRELKDTKVPLNLVGSDYDQRFLQSAPGSRRGPVGTQTAAAANWSR